MNKIELTTDWILSTIGSVYCNMGICYIRTENKFEISLVRLAIQELRIEYDYLEYYSEADDTKYYEVSFEGAKIIEEEHPLFSLELK